MAHMVKTPWNAGDAGDVDSMPGLERSPGVRNASPLQYSCLENPMDRGAWRATVHGVTKSRTRLSDSTHSIVFLLGKIPWTEKLGGL